uniref:Pleckstrin homology-like domain family B member 2-like n=1 Tax=Saccoglossus kowalevskii TaxID=10224 RepID=A0ABM0LTX2_SACKO|nr:PREDICTED: pleckstrin homology-like domain family B member 2-like [Saccoglossus kowalevskii]
MENLEMERKKYVKKIEEHERQLQELDIDAEEVRREIEIEKALLEGEHKSEMDQLQQDSEKVESVKQFKRQISHSAVQERQRENKLFEDAKQNLEILEQEYDELEMRLESCDESEKEEYELKLKLKSEVLEAERKIFEDLEFRHLEMESRMEEEQEIIEQELSREEDEKKKIISDRVALQRNDEPQDKLDKAKDELENIENRYDAYVVKAREIDWSLDNVQSINKVMSLMLLTPRHDLMYLK